MTKLECEFNGGCVVQRLSTALEEIPFMGRLGDKAAGAGDPIGVVKSSSQKKELIVDAEDLANTEPCITCFDQPSKLHIANRTKLNKLR